MSNPRIETSPDGRVRMEIDQGTRPVMGPLRIGVLATRGEGEPDGPSARVQVSLHRDLGIESPGTIVLVPDDPLRIDGFGELELIDVVTERQGGGPDDAGRDRILLELRPL